jgi:NAD(P)-dependent dehydrogenase (short-subunit alcohol dehydrogenase family)
MSRPVRPGDEPQRTGSVLVVGASSGFGLALANDLAADGLTVTGAARSVRPPAARFAYRQVDVSDEESVRELVGAVRADQGAMGGLVYSVSNTSAIGQAWELGAEQVIDVLQASYVGLVRLVRYVVPEMLREGGGSIVVVGSRAARVPVPMMAGYGAAKAALEHYVRCVAEELRDSGVRINTIGISADTKLARRHLELRGGELGRAALTVPLPDVADNLPCARFLLSPESRFLTGQTLEARQPLWT